MVEIDDDFTPEINEKCLSHDYESLPFWKYIYEAGAWGLCWAELREVNPAVSYKKDDGKPYRLREYLMEQRRRDVNTRVEERVANGEDRTTAEADERAKYGPNFDIPLNPFYDDAGMKRVFTAVDRSGSSRDMVLPDSVTRRYEDPLGKRVAFKFTPSNINQPLRDLTHQWDNLRPGQEGISEKWYTVQFSFTDPDTYFA